MRQVAAGIAAQFGSSCEVAIHDLSKDPDRSIVFIANGHVSGRKVGDGASNVVMEQLRTQDPEPKDHLCYLTKTPDGKILKSSTVYIRDRKGKVSAIMAINYDISRLMLMEEALRDLVSTGEEVPAEPEKITNVNDLLEELIQQSVALVGKPAALMNKEEKIRAIQFLNDAVAFLITKSVDKVSKYFGISKFTLYSYIDVNNRKQEEGAS